MPAVDASVQQATPPPSENAEQQSPAVAVKDPPVQRATFSKWLRKLTGKRE
jgi:hypothetical protein